MTNPLADFGENQTLRLRLDLQRRDRSKRPTSTLQANYMHFPIIRYELQRSSRRFKTFASVWRVLASSQYLRTERNHPQNRFSERVTASGSPVGGQDDPPLTPPQKSPRGRKPSSRSARIHVKPPPNVPAGAGPQLSDRQIAGWAETALKGSSSNGVKVERAGKAGAVNVGPSSFLGH